jgi:hypothetical protein
MPWQTPTINPATTSPANDITKITNDLAVLKSLLTTGSTDTDFSQLSIGYTLRLGSGLDVAAAGSTLLYSYAGGTFGTARCGIRLDGSNQRIDINTGSTTIGRFDSDGRFILGGSIANDGVNALQVTGTTRSTLGFKPGNSAVADANTLDWYEEGTFTPAIAGLTVAGTGTYSIQVARYQRIGNTVRVFISLTWSAHTGTGTLTVTGLPFTSASTSGSPMSIMHENLTFTSTKMAVATIPPTGTILYINLCEQSTAATLVAMDSAASVIITGFYFVP